MIQERTRTSESSKRRSAGAKISGLHQLELSLHQKGGGDPRVLPYDVSFGSRGDRRSPPE